MLYAVKEKVPLYTDHFLRQLNINVQVGTLTTLQSGGEINIVMVGMFHLTDQNGTQKSGLITKQTRSSKEHHGSPCDGSVKSTGPLCYRT